MAANNIPVNGAAPAGAPADNYTQLLFIDNDADYLSFFQRRVLFGAPQPLPSVTLIKAPSKIANESIYLTHPDFMYLAGLLSPAGRHIFCLNSMMYGVVHGDNYDRTAGINQAIVGQVQAWIDANPAAVKAVGIDLDRTLTQFEGLSSPYGADKPSFQQGYLDYLLLIAPARLYLDSLPPEQQDIEFLKEGYVEYTVGGAARLALLRDMFDRLYAAGVDIYIITNNGGCLSQRTFMMEFLHKLINPADQDRPFQLICSRAYQGNKRSAWRNAQPRVRPILSVAGGGRRARKTRRNSHRRRTTRI